MSDSTELTVAREPTPSPAPSPAKPGPEAGDTGFQPTSSPPTGPEDPDVRALREAQEEADREARGGDTPPPQSASRTEETPQPAPQQSGGRGKGKLVVPKARLDEALQKEREAREEAARLRGRLEALEASTRQPAPGTAAPPPAQAPAPTGQMTGPNGEVRRATDAERQERAAQIADLRSRALALADQFDQGEITMRAYVEGSHQLIDAETAIRETDLAQFLLSSVPRPPAPQIAYSDQALLNEQLGQLQQEFPWVAVLNADQTTFLADTATREAASRGAPYGQGVQETMRLRRHIAELAQDFGPRWYPGVDPVQLLNEGNQAPSPAAPRPAAPASSSPAAPTPPASRPAPRVIGQHPPDVHNLGNPNSRNGEVTEADVDNMSTEEIAALPASVRERLLNRR